MLLESIGLKYSFPWGGKFRIIPIMKEYLPAKAVGFTGIGYDEIEIGRSATLEKCITEDMMDVFARLTGDYNPVHMDDSYCIEHGFDSRTVFGLLTVSFVSAFIGVYLPGNGSVCLSHSFDFLLPVRIGDTIKITGTVVKKDNQNALGLNIVTIKFGFYNQLGRLVVKGTSKVSAKR